MSKEAMKLVLEALEEIALAGMSGTGQESEESMTEWHARQAWKFIGIAARALDPIREAQAAQPAQQEPCGYEHHEHRPYGAPGEVRIHAVLASQYKMPDGTIADDFQWLIDEYKADPNTIKLLPLYTTPQATHNKENQS